MKKKILGIIVCMLLIVTTVIPVTGNIKMGTTSPLMAINTSVDEISPYNQPSSTITITATGPSDLDTVGLYYRWSSDNVTWTGLQKHSILEGFESGSQNTSLWNTYQSPGDSRIQWDFDGAHSGSYSCAMDDYDSNQGDYELNVIYTNFDFSDASNINIDFWQRHWGDEAHGGPDSWSGWGGSSSRQDAVAYTNDGNTWYKIISASELNRQVWTQYEYDISKDEDFSSPPNSDFAIAFTQYDNVQLYQDGRAWDDITIEYAYGAPSKDWEFWANPTNPDKSYPWSWNFYVPHGPGYYEFYSIGIKDGESETPPTSADARCRYNEDPEIFDENPPDGAEDVPIVPELDISISDAEGETMSIYWYSNSEGSWEVFGRNIDVENGTYSQINSNFSDYETTYYWYVTVTDAVYTTSSPIFQFTTEENLPPYTPNTPNPEDGATDVPINKVLSWIGGDPNPGDKVTYDIYIGTSSPPPLEAEGLKQAAYMPEPMNLETKYYWKIIAEDSMGQTTAGPIWSFTTQSEPNEPPEAPDIYGPPSGPPGKELIWAFISFDYDGDQLKYIIDWGDGNIDETAYYPESTVAEASHTYETQGEYTIIAKAEDEKGVEGGESTFEVTVVKTKAVYHKLYLRLFELFPMLEKFLNLFRFC